MTVRTTLQVHSNPELLLEKNLWATLPRARPIARGQEHLDHQSQHLNFARVHQWNETVSQVRQCYLSRCMASVQYEPAWNPRENDNVGHHDPGVTRHRQLSFETTITCGMGGRLPQFGDSRFRYLEKRFRALDGTRVDFETCDSCCRQQS